MAESNTNRGYARLIGFNKKNPNANDSYLQILVYAGSISAWGCRNEELQV